MFIKTIVIPSYYFWSSILIVVIIVGLAIYGVDSLLSLGMKGIKNLAQTTTTTTSVSQQGESTTAAALDKATTKAAE